MLTDYQLEIAVHQLCSRRMQDPYLVIGEYGKTHGSVARAEILAALQVQAAIAFASQQNTPQPSTNQDFRTNQFQFTGGAHD